MSLPFPAVTPQQVLHCFLTPNEEHDRLMVELNYTLLFISIGGNDPPPHLLSFLGTFTPDMGGLGLTGSQSR